jgi:hypothetical protein
VTARILDDAIRDLDFETVPDATTALDVPDAPSRPEDVADVRFALTVGLFDVIAEDAAAPTPQEAIAAIEAALRRVQSLATVTRFALFECLDAAERQERGARMNGLDIAMTRHWMIPRLRHDIRLYAERIEALRRALEEDTG